MAAYTSRDLVEDFLRYRLLTSGLRADSVPPRLRPAGAQRGQAAAASAPTSSRRSGRHVTSHRGVAPVDSQQGRCSAPPRLQVALRWATAELERRYQGDLAAHVSALLLSDGGQAARRRGLAAVRDELFSDGVNWGRIVAMMELGGALCTEVVRRGGAWQVDDISTWMEESLDSPLLRAWIELNGGWDAFVELFGKPRPPVGSWSLRTVFGLAVLGAAGITLGLLFMQR